MAKAPTTEFVAHQTSIPGLIFFDILDVHDERGYFQEKYQKAKLVAAGMPGSFTAVQNSISFNKQKGATRGFHAEPWDKYISVVTGRVFCAYVDLRPGENFGKAQTIEITPNKAVFCPAGVANSFQTLDDDTYYLYSVNKHWSAEDYDKYCFVNLADPEIGIDWPIPLDRATLSDRDRNHPLLRDAKQFKVELE